MPPSTAAVVGAGIGFGGALAHNASLTGVGPFLLGIQRFLMAGFGMYHWCTRKNAALQRLEDTYGEEGDGFADGPSFARKYALRELWAVIQSVIGMGANACYAAAFSGDFTDEERVRLLNIATWIGSVSFVVGIVIGMCFKEDSEEPTVWEVDSEDDDTDSLAGEASLFATEDGVPRGSVAV